MGLLDGDIAALFSAAFSGMYLDATVNAGTGEPIYGAGGVITGYSGSSQAAKAQVDAATQAMRQADGFAEGDVRLIILANGVAVTSDHSVTVAGVKYSLQSVELDAAASHWVCRGRKVPT
ncbi:hypothetical protein [Novosphingobium pentaromativorans]|uniref:Uncharacterized protein n=1 Tax=Novosphingobium pentaromativorans US6-1 TaxID=1088721 RepID=G6E7J9_9SPHN|nr:hypothetical protein [Novosphingobium pentaromativorans]EHJ62822.1 hypothetical protein NSU_0334 [Novosphingobium pentaromativorans US6-1]